MIDAVNPNAVNTAKTTPSNSAPATKVAEGASASAVKISQVTTPLSPRLKFDPVAGVVVTEFLDTHGSIASQAPSAAVMAYLRVGLSPDGLDKKNEAVPSSGDNA